MASFDGRLLTVEWAEDGRERVTNEARLWLVENGDLVSTPMVFAGVDPERPARVRLLAGQSAAPNLSAE